MWTRKSFVTRGADPTEVVEWSNGEFKLIKFQNTYQVKKLLDKGGSTFTTYGPLIKLGKALHEALESAWQTSSESCTNDGVNYGQDLDLELAQIDAGNPENNQ